MNLTAAANEATLSEAAEILGVEHARLAAMAYRGTIPAKRSPWGDRTVRLVHVATVAARAGKDGPDEWMPARMAAKILGINYGTILKWTKRGVVPSTRQPALTVDLSDVEAALVTRAKHRRRDEMVAAFRSTGGNRELTALLCECTVRTLDRALARARKAGIDVVKARAK